MSKVIYAFTKTDGCLRPIVPILLENPYTRNNFALNCLLDTGADSTLLPEFISSPLNTVRVGPKSEFTGIAGIKIIAYEHLIKLHLLRPNGTDKAWSSKNIMVACVPRDEHQRDIPPLLGSKDFLINFNIEFNYKKSSFTIEI
jgi:hypothetical protein